MKASVVLPFLCAILGLASAPISLQAAKANKYLVNPSVELIRISPDGKHVALWERQLDGLKNVVVADTDAFKRDPFIVSDGKGGQGEVTDLRWVGNEHLVLLSKGEDDADWLHSFKIGTARPTRLRKEGRRTLMDIIPDDTRFFVVEREKGDGPVPSRLVEYDVTDPAYERVVYERVTRSLECVLDATGQLRLLKRTDEKGEDERWYYLAEGTGGEKALSSLHPWMKVYGIEGDHGRALVGGHFGGANPSIQLFDLEADKPISLMADNARYSVVEFGEVVFGLENRRVLGLHLDAMVYASFWIDAELQGLQTELDEKLRGSVNRIRGWSKGYERLLVERIFPMLPTLVCVVEPKSERITAIAVNGGRIKPEEVGSTRLVEIPSRDGLPLSALLTLPANAGEGKRPLVVWARQGLWDRVERLEWHPEANYFASLGYAALRVNYRGGQGMLGEYALAKNSSEGVRSVFRDIEDCVRALIDAGIVDADRVAIAGVGEGGWLAAYAPIATPGLYRAVVSFCGLYDLEAYRSPDETDVASAGVTLSFAGRGSSFSDEEVRALSVTQNLSVYAPFLFVAYGGWSPQGYIDQTNRFLREAKKAGSQTRFYKNDWWGAQVPESARHEGWDRAASLLKIAFK